jgi:hypothetical protein
MTAECGVNIAMMESRKQNLGVRGRGFAEPADVRIGREIASKVGNSKMIMIGQAHRFGRVRTKMVAL